MHQTQFSEKIPYGGFSQIRSHILFMQFIVGFTLAHLNKYSWDVWVGNRETVMVLRYLAFVLYCKLGNLGC